MTLKHAGKCAVLLGACVLIALTAFAGEPNYAPFDRDSLTISDHGTGLEWLRAPRLGAMPFSAAVGECGNVSLGDAGGDGDAQTSQDPSKNWRLPTIKELLSLVDERGQVWRGVRTYLVPNAFGNDLPGDSLLFGSRSSGTGNGYLYVDYKTGQSGVDGGSANMHVFCVRNFK